MNTISRGCFTPYYSRRRLYSSQENLRSSLSQLQNSWKETSQQPSPSVSERLNNIQYRFSKDLWRSLKKGFDVVENTSSTHYVFWHGACRKELSLRILFSELFFRSQSQKPLENEVLLRHPLLFDEKCKSLDWFKENLTGRGGMTDDHYQLEVISLDCTLNHQIGESAIGKLANPTRLKYASYNRSVAIIAHEVFKSLGSSFIQDFNELNASFYSDEFLEADLYVMCIPKSHFHEMGYVSKPFGVQYQIDDQEKLIEDCLKDLAPYWSGAPQIRVLAKKTIPYNQEIATLVFPGMPDDEFQSLVLRINALVGAYFEKLC